MPWREGTVTLATSCLRLAREACSGKAECARLTAALMRVQWWVDPAAARRHLSGLLEELWAGYLEPRDALTVFGGLFWTGQVAEADRALEQLTEGGTPPQDHAWLSAWYPGHAPVHSAAWRQGGTVSSSLMDHPWQRRTTEGSQAGTVDFLCGATGDDVVLREVVTAFTALVHSDPVDDVVARCDELEPEVGADAPVAARALYQACRVLVALRTGDTEKALAHAEGALDLMPAESWGVALAVPLACAVTATTVMGRYEAGANHLARALPEAAFDTPFGLLYLQTRGQFYLATGRPRNGLRDLEECEQRLATWRVPVPGLATWRSQAAQALVELGEVRRARRLVDLQMATLSGEQVRLRGTTLRVRAATEPPDHRTPLLSKAIGLLQQSGDRLELARAFADLARAHAVLGEQALARTAAQRCTVLAEQCAAQPLLEQMVRAFPELRPKRRSRPRTRTPRSSAPSNARSPCSPRRATRTARSRRSCTSPSARWNSTSPGCTGNCRSADAPNSPCVWFSATWGIPVREVCGRVRCRCGPAARPAPPADVSSSDELATPDIDPVAVGWWPGGVGAHAASWGRGPLGQLVHDGCRTPVGSGTATVSWCVGGRVVRPRRPAKT